MTHVERFRRRPLVVETMLWDGSPEAFARIREWTGGFFRVHDDAGCGEVWNTQEGCWVRCPTSHRVVKGTLEGEFYPISPDAIANTYDPAARVTTEQIAEVAYRTWDTYGGRALGDWSQRYCREAWARVVQTVLDA